MIDESIYDEVVSDFERLGGNLLDADEVEALAGLAFAADGSVNVGALGQSCMNLGAMADFPSPMNQGSAPDQDPEFARAAATAA